ncbi:MAG: DNA-binding protein [Spirulinaceae cyanobacterium RM2_2_10]|nr:DNA-binding protein [Spirulinaceae cyanobacterium SM2_1_0]NJO21023.1 DNA-binding protein [Spirulinaceae cyanobacterium RM2_2_10]
MKTYALRLEPGQDLRLNLEAFAQQQAIAAGFVLTAVGSLRVATLRFAGRAVATAIDGPCELLSLSGLLSAQGAHLHGAIACTDGRVLGGHIALGCIIYTTAEIVMGDCPNLCFRRELDPQTGYRELAIDTQA